MTTIHSIEDLADPRLAAYRDLRKPKAALDAGEFVLESALLVKRLLDSDYEVLSILVDRHLQQIDPRWLDADVPIYSIPDASALVGFHFHRGALACGRRKPKLSASAAIERWRADSERKNPWRAVYLHRVHDPENMGAIIRTCAVLGVQKIVVGPSCIDPFTRRVIRVSMGFCFDVDFVFDDNTSKCLDQMQAANIVSMAATPDVNAEILQPFNQPTNWTVLVGNEASGLPDPIMQQCEQRLRIAMQFSDQSLNVGHATAIFIYALQAAALAGDSAVTD